MSLETGSSEPKRRKKAINRDCAESKQYFQNLIVREWVQKDKENTQLYSFSFPIFSLLDQELWEEWDLSFGRKLNSDKKDSIYAIS